MATKNYENFKQEFVTLIEARLGEDEELKQNQVTKNNNTLLDAICIIKPGYNVFPTTYLNYYYDAYQHGKTIEELVDEVFYIAETYTGTKEELNEVIESYEKTKDNIVVKLVNTKMNEELLKAVPHKAFLDLSIIPYVLIDATPDGGSSVVVTNELAERLGVDPETLLNNAISNTETKLSPKIYSMGDICEIFTKDYIPMYMLSNDIRYNGAAVLLKQEVLETLAEEFNSDLTIIPASTHEVLVVPTWLSKKCENLNSLICEVNNTELKPEEILSDHEYIYDKDAKQVRCA